MTVDVFIATSAAFGVGGALTGCVLLWFVVRDLARIDERLSRLERKDDAAREALDRTQTNIRQMYGGARS